MWPCFELFCPHVYVGVNCCCLPDGETSMWIFFPMVNSRFDKLDMGLLVELSWSYLRWLIFSQHAWPRTLSHWPSTSVYSTMNEMQLVARVHLQQLILVSVDCWTRKWDEFEWRHEARSWEHCDRATPIHYLVVCGIQKLMLLLASRCSCQVLASCVVSQSVCLSQEASFYVTS